MHAGSIHEINNNTTYNALKHLIYSHANELSKVWDADEFLKYFYTKIHS